MKTLWLFLIVLSFWVLFSLVSGRTSGDRQSRKVLVFGGNGLLGSSVVDRFIRARDNVTIVNRGNWYYDSYSRIRPFVKVINCDRSTGIANCAEFKELVEKTDQFNAVIDFSAFSANNTRDAAELLKNKAALLIHISTDQVYGIAHARKKEEPLTEDEPITWPDDPHRESKIRVYNSHAAGKLDAEDAVREQRLDGGIPYIILRLPDVIGPRDTSYRFWMYQIWLKIYPHLKINPVVIPAFLKDQPLSFVYSEDVGKKVFELVGVSDPEVLDNVYNLAWDKSVTLVDLLMAIQENLNLSENQEIVFDKKGTARFMYPTGRTGPLNISKARKKLGWRPAPWKQAVRESVQWYENIVKEKKFDVQLDEIVQVVANELYNRSQMECYKAIEKAYDIDLQHFWNVKDEL